MWAAVNGVKPRVYYQHLTVTSSTSSESQSQHVILPCTWYRSTMKDSDYCGPIAPPARRHKNQHGWQNVVQRYC